MPLHDRHAGKGRAAPTMALASCTAPVTCPRIARRIAAPGEGRRMECTGGRIACPDALPGNIFTGAHLLRAHQGADAAEVP